MSGLHPHPGPTWTMDTVEGDFLLECINLTSLVANCGTLVKRECHATFFQEHLVPVALAGKWHTVFKDADMMTLLGPTDPEHNKHSAGVGAACEEPHFLVKLAAKSDLFKAAQTLGRLDAYTMEFHNMSVMFFVIFGWTGGHTDREAAQRTDGLFGAIEEEITLHPRCPTGI